MLRVAVAPYFSSAYLLDQPPALRVFSIKRYFVVVVWCFLSCTFLDLRVRDVLRCNHMSVIG